MKRKAKWDFARPVGLICHLREGDHARKDNVARNTYAALFFDFAQRRRVNAENHPGRTTWERGRENLCGPKAQPPRAKKKVGARVVRANSSFSFFRARNFSGALMSL